jgi:uncharacterized membrane protein
MRWIILKVTSDVLSACNVLLAKEMLSSRVQDQRLYLLSVAVVALPFAGIGFWYLWTLGSWVSRAIALLAGIAYIAAGYFYYKAMSVIEPSRLSLISRLGMVFIVFLSFFVLKEKLTFMQYLGCGMSFAGGLVMVMTCTGNIFRFDQGIRSALLSNLCMAFSFIFKVYLIQHNSYTSWQIFTMSQIGVVLGIPVLFGLKGTWETCRSLCQLPFVDNKWLLGEQVIRLIALFIHTEAIAQIGSAITMSVFSGFSPLYVWCIAVIRKQETFRTRDIWQKLFALTLFLGTSYLMQA